MNNKYLIICAVGDKSFHEKWLKGNNRRFDVMLIYYGNEKGRYAGEAEYYLECREIGKMHKISAGINKFKEEIKQYDLFCLADDDLIANQKQFNLLFEKFEQYGLDIGQPAIEHGFISYRLTRRHVDCQLRYVNFIETMCPLFRTSLLDELLPTLTINKSSWGLDFLWSQIFKDKKIAVLDCVAMGHKDFLSSSRSLFFSNETGEYYKILHNAGISEKKEFEDVVAKIDPKVLSAMFLEKGRIKKPLLLRLFLFPILVYDFIRWNLFFILKKILPAVYSRSKKILAGIAKTKESLS